MPLIESGALIAQRYRLENRLDAGGRAQVWTATDEELKREVAVKILLTPAGGDPAFVEAFRAEAQLEAKLKHPNIVEVFDWGHDGDVNFEVMEFVSGFTAAQLLANGPMAPDRVILAGRQIASALAHAHAEGVAHGTIGADHVLIGPAGKATLIDFGLQCRGQCETPTVADADTYALGGLLYEMLTGADPWGPRPENIPDNEPWPQHPHKITSAVPNELDHIVMKAISSNPNERYRTAAELEAALDELVRPKSRAWLWITLAVLAVLLAAGGVWWYTQQSRVAVPEVTGKVQAEAQVALSSVGLNMVVTGQLPSDSVPSGAIVSQSPTAGTSVKRGSDVGVTVSTGKATASTPGVTGLDLQTATERIVAAGFVVGTLATQPNSTIASNTVISQSPAAGTALAAGSAVDLVVSAGKTEVKVPSVVGMTQADATNDLENDGFTVVVNSQYSSQPKGQVIGQSPAAGTTVTLGSTVTITVSKGVAPVQVPNVVDALAADAKTSLQNVGLVPVSVEESGTAAQVGKVITQDPEAGTKVAPGSQVKITIGK